MLLCNVSKNVTTVPYFFKLFPILHFYIPRKHQKNVKFSIFRKYGNVTLGRNELKHKVAWKNYGKNMEQGFFVILGLGVEEMIFTIICVYFYLK